VVARSWSGPPTQVLEYHEALGRRGAYVQFDTIRRGSEHEIDVDGRCRAA
jgi:hypothetical protein